MVLDPLNLIKKAEESRLNGEFLINKTYSLLNEPKIFLGVIKNFYDSLDYMFDAILYYGVNKKKVPKIPSDFITKKDFIVSFLGNMGLDDSVFGLANYLNNVLKEHNDAAVEFSRHGSLVICDDDYNLEKISASLLREHNNLIKESINKIKGLLENE